MVIKQWSAVIRSALALIAAVALAACGGGDAGFGTSRGDLVGTTYRDSATATAINSMAVGALPGYSASYDVACHRMVYKTPAVSGTLIDASALLCVPQKGVGTTSPILSFDHGTIFADTEAPSVSGSTFGYAAAGLGYVTVMPDYIGYGVSSGYAHPYLHAQTLASTTVDAVRATRSYLRQQGNSPGKLFLSGYSEGGYAALATQRAMEQEFASEFTITASVPGAGPYNLLQTARDVLAADTLVSSGYVAEVFTTYDAIYNTNSQLSRYFREPYATFALTAFDGSHSAGEIESGFSHTTATLLNDTFLADFRGSGETELKAHLEANNLHDTWTPHSRTVLFHGEQDEVVPYINATATRDHASSANVSVHLCDAGGAPTTHGACGLPYWRYIMTLFAGLDPGL